MTDRAKEVEAIKQKLAAIEHERWSDWQKWCHEVIRKHVPYSPERELVLTRWDKQIETPYDKLSEAEQASDMEQVDRYWPLIEEFIRRAEVEAAELEWARISLYIASSVGFEWYPADFKAFRDSRLKELRGEQ